MKVTVERVGPLLLLQTEKPGPYDILADTGINKIVCVGYEPPKVPFVSIFATSKHERGICVSSRRQQELRSDIGIGIMIFPNEREAYTGQSRK